MPERCLCEPLREATFYAIFALAHLLAKKMR